MLKRKVISMLFVVMALVAASELTKSDVQAGGRGQPTNWNRFYYYPYVYYPHNFQNNRIEYDHLYYRYPANRRIPVYNKAWHNYYPSPRPYHKGHHFILDVF